MSRHLPVPLPFTKRPILGWSGLLALLLVVLASPAGAQPAETGTLITREQEVRALDGGLVVETPDAGMTTLTPPTLLTDAPAQYPEGDWTGPRTVTLELLLTEQGTVERAEVVQGAEAAFNDAAVRAATGLRFTPATLDGTPVSVRLPFTYRFEPPAEPASRTVLTGLIRSKGTRKPLGDAAVTVNGATVTTDAEGHFELALKPGLQEVHVSAPGYKPADFREELKEDQRLEVRYGLEPLVVNPYETVVRGDRERTEVSRITLHDQEVREVPGTQGDPFRVVMLMPGVGSVASGLSYPVVRGSQPAATGYSIDGVRVPMLYHLLLGPAVVHPEFIDSIDFQAGAPPVRYGRTLGGAVDGRLSRPREKGLHASAYADLLNAGGFVEVPIEETGTSVTVSGRLSYSALLVSLAANALSVTSGEEVSSGYRADFWDYQARVEQKVGEGRLRLLVFGSSDLLGLKAESKNDYAGDLAMRFHRVDLRGQHPLWGGEAEVGLTWGLDQLGTTARRGPTKVGEFGMAEQTFRARAGWSKGLTDTLSLSLGADVEHRRGGFTLTGIAIPPGTRGDDPTDALRRPSTLATFSGLYGELSWKPDARWSVVTGLRGDSWHLVPGISYYTLEPRLAVRHAMTESLTLKAGAGLYHQPPTVLVQLPVMDAAGLRYGLQNGMQFDLGAEWKALEGLELSADAWYNPLPRTVEFSFEQLLENRRRRNAPAPDPASHGYAYGLELMARHPLGGNWFGWVSYGFQQSKRWARFDRYDDQDQVVGQGEGYLPFAFEQVHVFNAALSYRFPGNLTVGAVVHFNTGRPETGELSSRNMHVVRDEEGVEHWVRTDPDRAERLPPYFRVDARISKTWTLDAVVVDAYLDVLNLSLQREVLAYDYTYTTEDWPGTDVFADRKPMDVPPVVLPLLGVKVSY
ncbi:TonB-dependent receptor [Archangium violaceum]|uniref:TonB-dependent receptor domain-containing protein n=1 Tax=Archangium violaceum TaxID=83451 RepID=UPI001950F0A9|nr:TonB-dependent receptor [Archangium violaceum]QRN99048.1 TonB-dependent receptor [Archangium violaceum]